MLFNSPIYLFLFLPITILVFFALRRWRRDASALSWLVVASLFFYGFWNPVYLLLIGTSLAVNFWTGIHISNRKSAYRRAWLVSGVAFNLLLLGYFKYTDFLLTNVNAIAGTHLPVPQITLPLAISFFTFQQIAFLVDSYYTDLSDYHLVHYALFVTFFPQLIAGPIVHHREMMPQFHRLRDIMTRRQDLAVGITFIAAGLFKKVVLADSLAPLADSVFNHTGDGHTLTAGDAWVGSLAFTFQIYFDFSGYTDLAIGSARLFGIRLPENFNSPYKATSIIDFWRLWHITLSRFLRHYLYIPLGGNRHGRIRRHRNLFITMVLGGLWHGASWNYVIWGAIHGVALVGNHIWRATAGKLLVTEHPVARAIGKLFAVALTFFIVNCALIFFRAPDISGAWQILLSLFHPDMALSKYYLGLLEQNNVGQFIVAISSAGQLWVQPVVLLSAAAALCWFAPNTQQWTARWQPVINTSTKPVPTRLLWRPNVGWALFTSALLTVSLMSIGTISRFIYFQF